MNFNEFLEAEELGNDQAISEEVKAQDQWSAPMNADQLLEHLGLTDAVQNV